MALGIFALASGRVLLSDWPNIWHLLGFLILVLWGVLAGEFLARSLCQWPCSSEASESERFVIGTWVAGTAVPASVSAVMWPDFFWLSRTLTILASLLLLIYSSFFLRGYARLIHRWKFQESRGEILLASVSIQSVILAFHTSWTNALEDRLVLAINSLSAVLLVVGIGLILAGLRRFRWHRLAEGWSNTNCILHGALSITGLTLATITENPHPVLSLWLLTGVILIVVEALELIRAMQRVRRYGWLEGLVCYHVSQWARNFTFGMFYAFSLQLQGRLGADAGLSLLDSVVKWGPLVVLAFLIIEIALFIRDRLRPILHPAG